ncbi:type II toxin-antitoxin system YoeB family toxin [Sphingomonas sp.]|uniref:type II toxin-antitoxin system YoeB family toxin n=1 Tax=Sphingomonas sp. TaxID=28214 RepID=UPI0035A99BD9
MIEDCRRDRCRGAAKPEARGKSLTGWWSRRVTDAQRLVYRKCGSGEAPALNVLSCRDHY